MVEEIPRCPTPQLREVLFRLCRDNRNVFERLFLLEEEVTLPKSIARRLAKAGLIGQSCRKLFTSSVRIWKTGKAFIATDLFTSKREDRVYPIFVDESDFLAKNLIVQTGDEVLDLCTGSGIQAICCAKKAKFVLGLDTSQRALAFARFNSRLNGADKKVKFIHSDLFQNIGKRKFDFIVSNPPFISVPHKGAWFLHGEAGYTGLREVKKIVAGAKEFLKSRGRLQLIINSFGDGKKIQVVELVKMHFPKSRIQIIHVMKPSSISSERFLERFKGSEGYRAWAKYLRINKLGRLYRMVINIFPAQRFSLETIRNKNFRFCLHELFNQKPFKAKPYHSGGWKEMLGRYGDISRISAGARP